MSLPVSEEMTLTRGSFSYSSGEEYHGEWKEGRPGCSLFFVVVVVSTLKYCIDCQTFSYSETNKCHDLYIDLSIYLNSFSFLLQ